MFELIYYIVLDSKTFNEKLVGAKNLLGWCVINVYVNIPKFCLLLINFHYFRLTPSDFILLVGNYEEIVLAHSRLLISLEDQLKKSPRAQQIGGAFLQHAPSLKKVHSTYTANHPKAVCVIERYK